MAGLTPDQREEIRGMFDQFERHIIAWQADALARHLKEAHGQAVPELRATDGDHVPPVSGVPETVGPRPVAPRVSRKRLPS